LTNPHPGCIIKTKVEKTATARALQENRRQQDMPVIIETTREGYALDQVRHTLTVRELKDYLNEFDDDAKIYLSFDSGYTYGGIHYQDFRDGVEELEAEE
jgi:hypothetical protein